MKLWHTQEYPRWYCWYRAVELAIHLVSWYQIKGDPYSDIGPRTAWECAKIVWL